MVEHLGNPNSTSFGEEYESFDSRGDEKVQSVSSSILLRHVSGGYALPRAHGSTFKRKYEIDAADMGKHKRRSKNDSEGRMFKCQHCEKTYLSYPALYTHMKTKHISPVEVLPMNVGRSRGRPKKTPSTPASKDVDSTTFAYFATPERAGETKDPLETVLGVLKTFHSTLLRKYTPIETYPLWEHARLPSVKVEETEDKKNCDQVFCEYLWEVGKITNSGYFTNVVKFIVLYRECLNEYGWIKFASSLGVELEEEEKKEEEYSVENTAEFVPELANELVLSYLPEHGCGLSTAECTSLIINFCEWLIRNGYTCTRVNQIKK